MTDLKTEKLCRLAKRWGGSVERVSEETYESLQWERNYRKGKLRTSTDPTRLVDAPFSGSQLGVIHSEKRVIYSDFVLPPWYELVHEMGHVFACGTAPAKSKEWDFFGWEYALAKMLEGVKEWIEGNEGYCVEVKR